MIYDAVIVGASFAGLSTARRLRGQVLLIDRKDIGSSQTSACATLLRLIEEVCPQSILQVYHDGFVHTPRGTVAYELPYPLCTFDYESFCRHLFYQSGAEFIQARALGVRDGSVITDRGEFRAKCVVDASGWRRALSRDRNEGFVNGGGLSFGLETEVSYRGRGLHFWVDPALRPACFSWLFPCGSYSRTGIGCYRGETTVSERLVWFLDSFGVKPKRFHGGFFPWRLNEPTTAKVFVVGDAAGQCLPLTGEGIRPALFFGSHLGDILQKVIDRKIGLEEGLGRYRTLVGSYRLHYAFFRQCQKLISLPSFWLAQLFRFSAWEPVAGWWLRRYWGGMAVPEFAASAFVGNEVLPKWKSKP